MGLRFFIGFLCAAVLLGLIWVISYSESMDRLSEDVNGTTVAIQHTRDQVAKQKQQIDLRLATNVLVEQVAQKTAVREQLKQDVRTLEAQALSIADSMTAAIQDVRAASVGMKFPAVAVANRRVIRDAVVEKVTEEAVTFKHTDGIANARSDELPEDLRDRFRLGEGVVAKPAPAVVQSGSTATPSTGGGTTSSANANDALANHSRALTQKRLSVADLNSNVARLEQDLDRAEHELRGSTSASQKYHSRARRDAVKAQLESFRRAHFAALAELRRFEAMPPPVPVGNSY